MFLEYLCVYFYKLSVYNTSNFSNSFLIFLFNSPGGTEHMLIKIIKITFALMEVQYFD